MDTTGVAVETLPASSLPYELLTLIFKRLELSELYNCHLVCKAWRQAGRDDSVLRPLCVKMRYTSRRQKQMVDVLAPRLKSPRSIGSDGHCHSSFRLQGRDEADATSWEELLKRGHLLQQIKFPPAVESVAFEDCPAVQGVIKGYSNQRKLHDSNIWRAKIDPIDNLMITTSTAGGLRVLSLEDGRELWCDPSVEGMAHLEYSEGWAVTDCHDGGDGVSFQIWKFDRLSKKASSDELPDRGVLKSAGSISCSFNPHAFCLRCPHLAVAGSHDVAIYDIAKRKLLRRFKHSLDPNYDWEMRYIEFDKDFIFLLASTWRFDDDDDDEEQGGLFIFENSREGRRVYDDSLCKLVCSSSWDINGRNMADLRYDEQVIQDCASLGIATGMSLGLKADQYQYKQTQWCSSVHPDFATESLVLCGLGTLLIIPNYKKVLKKAQLSGPSTHRPRIKTIGVGTGSVDDGASDLAVANGVAAFIATAHHLPTWIDLRSLLRADRNKSATEFQASTLCLGQKLLQDCSGFNFKATSCLQLSDTKLTVVCDFFKEVTPYACGRYSVALVMDFGTVLKAKLSNSDADLHQQPYKTTVRFYPTNMDDDLERPIWRAKRNKDPASRIFLPDVFQRLWRAWAPRRLPDLCPTTDFEVTPASVSGMVADGRLLYDERWPRREPYFDDDDYHSEDDEWDSLDDMSGVSDEVGSDDEADPHEQSGSGPDEEMQVEEDQGGETEGRGGHDTMQAGGHLEDVPKGQTTQGDAVMTPAAGPAEGDAHEAGDQAVHDR